MSVSRAESCLRIPNISSCLRIVLAFSTSSSSAKETSSAGDLVFSSWSFISRIQNFLWEWASDGWDCDVTGGKKEAAGLGLRGALGAPVPDASAGSSQLEPELNCIRLRSVGFCKDRKRTPVRQGPRRTMHYNAAHSKRFQHHENNDQDHQRCRYLIDYTIECLRMAVAVSGKIFYPPGEKPMQGGQYDHQRELCLQPSRREPPVVRIGPQPGKPKAKHPRRDHRRVDDGTEKPALHHLERFRLYRSLPGRAVIDKQAGQIEHSGHPGDHRNDVECFDPPVNVHAGSPRSTQIATV